MDFLVQRTVHVWVDLFLELRVPRDTAERWRPEFRREEPLLIATADGRAIREGIAALRDRGVGKGRWRATFSGERVELEPIE